jgi:hypothetical protein
MLRHTLGPNSGNGKDNGRRGSVWNEEMSVDMRFSPGVHGRTSPSSDRCTTPNVAHHPMIRTAEVRNSTLRRQKTTVFFISFIACCEHNSDAYFEGYSTKHFFFLILIKPLIFVERVRAGSRPARAEARENDINSSDGKAGSLSEPRKP